MSWVDDAIAQQEEHIKRVSSCRGEAGRAHAWRAFGDPATGEKFERCVVCCVSKEKRDPTNKTGDRQ